MGVPARRRIPVWDSLLEKSVDDEEAT